MKEEKTIEEKLRDMRISKDDPRALNKEKTLEEQLRDMKIKRDPSDIAIQKINAKSDAILIKYYNLRAQSRKASSDLEVNLQKHFIAKASAGDGTSETLSRPIYDSEGFDILYKKSNSRKNVELVVKATPENLLELQDYLSTSNFGTIEEENVYYATLQFVTPPYWSEIKEYMEKLDHYFKLKYPQLKDRRFTTYEGDWTWQGLGCTGMMHGLVTDILEIRKFLLKGVYSLSCLVKVKKESVTFSSKIP